MELKEGSTLYVRIDYKIGEQEEDEQVALECMEYLQRLAKERYLVAGILGDMELGQMDGAMLLFEAKDMAVAQAISRQDPIIAKGFYRCEVYKWNVMQTSGSAGAQ